MNHHETLLTMFHTKTLPDVLPSLGSLSPSRGIRLGTETSCFTPGLRLSRANGQSKPSVDRISIVGAGGKVFSSAVKETEGGKGYSEINCLHDMQEKITKYQTHNSYTH